MNNAQLPDLLNGTVNNNTMNLDLDPKQLLKNLGTFGTISNHGENTHDDWESAFKYLMNNKNMSKHYEDQQQEDWLRYQEMRKHTGMSSGLGLNQFNMFNSKFDGSDFYIDRRETDFYGKRHCILNARLETELCSVFCIRAKKRKF